MELRGRETMQLCEMYQSSLEGRSLYYPWSKTKTLQLQGMCTNHVQRSEDCTTHGAKVTRKQCSSEGCVPILLLGEEFASRMARSWNDVIKGGVSKTQVITCKKRHAKRAFLPDYIMDWSNPHPPTPLFISLLPTQHVCKHHIMHTLLTISLLTTLTTFYSYNVPHSLPQCFLLYHGPTTQSSLVG